MMRASRAAQIAHAPDRASHLVTRSGMAGLHRYAQTRSGDNLKCWKTLRYNLKMELGLALSGVSNLGHVVGGFAGPKPDPELFVRWVQAGVLMPRFSIHAWNDDGTVNEPWMHPQVLPAIRRLMALRQMLVPFFDDLACRYAREFEPIVRPLWLFPPVSEGALRSECVDPVARLDGGTAPVGQWAFDGSASADTITLHVRGPVSADQLAIVLPLSETRRLAVTYLQ